GAVPLLDAATQVDAEWVQRVARLRSGRLGAEEWIRARVAQLRAVRCAARSRGRTVARPAAGAPRAAAVEGSLPARQSPAFQPQVLPELAAPLSLLRCPLS